MSVKAIAAVWDRSEAVGNDRLVLLAIADSADHDGENAWPSIDTIATKTRLSTRTVQRCIKSLEDPQRELRIERNAGGTAEWRDDRRPNRYTVTPGGFFMDGRPNLYGATDCHPAPESANHTSVFPQATRVDGDPETHGVTSCHPAGSARGDAVVIPLDGHGVTPSASRGDNRDVDGVTDRASRGDTAVTQTVLDPSTNPSKEPSTTPQPPAQRGAPRSGGSNPRALGTNPRGRYDGPKKPAFGHALEEIRQAEAAARIAEENRVARERLDAATAAAGIPDPRPLAAAARARLGR